MVIFVMVVYYMFLSVLVPLIVDTTGDAATAVESSPHAGTYIGAAEGARYTPLALYFVPAIGAVGAVVFKLKHKGSG